MPLNLPKLELDIFTLVEDMATRTTGGATAAKQARKDYARNLAKLIDAYVRSGLVVTAGSATTQTGTIQ